MTKIKMKTRNLTQSRARNDLINHRIHGFSFCDFEDKDGFQDVIFPCSLDQFLISNPPRTRKRVKKVKKSKDSQIVVSRQFDFTRKSKGKFSSRKTFGFIDELGVTVGSNGRSRSTVGFAYHHLVPISADTVVLLPVSSTQYHHPVLDDGYRIKGEFGCGTGCFQYRSGTG